MEGTVFLFTVTLKERSSSEMETPFILHPLQWLDNLFVGNLFLQSLQGPGSKHEDEPGWAACVMQQLLLAIYFTYGNIYIFQGYSLSLSHPHLPSLCLQVCSLCWTEFWSVNTQSLTTFLNNHLTTSQKIVLLLKQSFWITERSNYLFSFYRIACSAQHRANTSKIYFK